MNAEPHNPVKKREWFADTVNLFDNTKNSILRNDNLIMSTTKRLFITGIATITVDVLL